MIGNQGLPLAGLAEQLLLGRNRETNLIRDRYEAALVGRASVVLIAGEPGIGKTSLLRAVASGAANEGASVLWGGASEAEGMPPYLPFLEALGAHIRSTPAELLRDQVGQNAPTLMTILPELALRLGKVEAGYVLPVEQARLRLFEAVGHFISAIAAQPLILALDDLQWADASSLDLLTFLSRHQADAHLLVLGTYREAEAEKSPALLRTLDELNRLRALTTVRLGPLSEDEVAALVDAHLPGQVDGEVNRVLYAQSEGNPFFAEELLRGWLENGTLSRVENRWFITASTQESLPPTIISAIRRRVERLTPDTVDLLRTASIIGRTFRVGFLSVVAGQEAEDVEDLLLDAARARLLQRGQGDVYRFSHDKIRECLYIEVSATRRSRLHGFIGRALETEAGDANAQRLAELAYHFSHSGDKERGISYSQSAAEAALQAYAPDEAVLQLRITLDLVEQDDPRRGAVLLSLGNAELYAGHEHEAAISYEAARNTFLRLGDRSSAGAAAHGLGLARWRLEELAAARAALEEALRLLEEIPGPALVRVLVDLASLLALSLASTGEGTPHAERAMELARSTRDKKLLASASRTLGNLLVRSNRIIAGMMHLQEALELAVTADDPAEAAECCSCLSLGYYWLGQMEQSGEMSERRMEYAQRSNEPFQLRHVFIWLGAAQLFRGRFAQAEELLFQARAAVERLASPEPLAFVQICQGSLAHYRGDYTGAQTLYESGITTMRSNSPDSLVWYLGFLGLNQAALGRRQDAMATMQELEEITFAQPSSTMALLEGLSPLALLAVQQGNRDLTARCYDALLPFRGLYTSILVDRVLGEVATYLSNLTAAERHLIEAESAARREGLDPEIGYTLVARANLEVARGGKQSTASARFLLEQALDLFTRIGMTGDADRLLNRLVPKSQQTGARASVKLAAGLSERELEVLRLAAEGKSNSEIAVELALSAKTVANHLTNIYSKTGTDNRAAATAFAIRHGLA